MKHDENTESLEVNIARLAHRRRVFWWSICIVFVLLGIALFFLAQQRMANKGKISYKQPSDSLKVVYIVAEPNTQLALQGAQRTMQATYPRFSAVIFITGNPESIPAQDAIDPSIKYLTADNESTAIYRAIEFAKDANWTARERHLYYSFSSTGKLDTLMANAVREKIFTAPAKLPLVPPKQ